MQYIQKQESNKSGSSDFISVSSKLMHECENVNACIISGFYRDLRILQPNWEPGTDGKNIIAFGKILHSLLQNLALCSRTESQIQPNFKKVIVRLDSVCSFLLFVDEGYLRVARSVTH